MGEETGRKSALRRVKLTVLLAVIFAVSLAPALSLRLFPRETLGYFLEPIWSIVGSRIGYSKEASVAVGIVASFVIAIVTGSVLLFVLFRGLTRSVRESK
jgi:uncharacterized membrane protein YeaQ/YmgE (transglycosylase-associated protein family)